MVNVLRNRKVLFTAWIVVMAFVLLSAVHPATRVEAASGSCTYYSNPSHTTIVGQYGRDCCNNVVAWGVKTKYSVCGGCFPCTPPPR